MNGYSGKMAKSLQRITDFLWGFFVLKAPKVEEKAKPDSCKLLRDSLFAAEHGNCVLKR